MVSSDNAQSKSKACPKGQELAGHIGVSHLLGTQTLRVAVKWELTGGLLRERGERKHLCPALGGKGLGTATSAEHG